MSEKFPSSSQEAVNDAIDASIAREHGVPDLSGRKNFDNGTVYQIAPGTSDNDMLEFYASQKHGLNSGATYQIAPGTSDNDMLEFYSSLPSEAEHEARIAEETGTIDPDKQKIVRDLQKFDFNDESLQEAIDTLADEPTAIERVIEMRLRKSLGDNHTESLKKDQLRADLKIIDLALEHGIDVGAMRIDAEPMLHEDKKTKPVGAWLDRLTDELNMTSMPSLENPDKLAPAHDQVTEIRNKLKDPEETPEEKAEREEAEAEAKAQEEEAARKEAERQENERNAKAAVEKAIEAQKQAYQTELDAKQLGHEIYAAKQELENALQEAASVKSGLGFFQQRFGKGKKSLAEANGRVAEIKQKIATLEDEQAQKIALLEGPNSAA